jgi:hypothetical protein
MEIMLLHQFEINNRLEALEKENAELKAELLRLADSINKLENE